MLYSQTDPVIESSSRITFYPWNYHYPELRSQFPQAKISIWNNNWSAIFDFTPKKNGKLNYKLRELKGDDLREYVVPYQHMLNAVNQIKEGVEDDDELDIADIQFDLNQISGPVPTGALDIEYSSTALCIFFECSDFKGRSENSEALF